MYVGVLLGSIQTFGAKRAQERVSDFSVRNGECGNAKKTIDGMLKSLCLLYRVVIDKSLFFGVGRGREWIACTMHLGPRACRPLSQSNPSLFMFMWLFSFLLKPYSL